MAPQTTEAKTSIVPEDGFVDLLTSSYGARQSRSWRARRFGRVADAIFDARLELNPSYRGLPSLVAQGPIRKVLVTSVDVPARHADLEAVVRALQKSRHNVTAILTPLGDRGKFQNINAGLLDVHLEEYDWLIVIDDDIDIPADFLDRFLCIAELTGLAICQPAHRFFSYTTWEVTQRVWNSLARVTGFVECGPVTAFHHSVFRHCLPFPGTRWAWGIDVLWSDLASEHGFRMGIIDGTPIGHLREVAGSYSRDAAIAEGHQLLAGHNVRRDSREMLKTFEVIHRLGSLPISGL